MVGTRRHDTPGLVPFHPEPARATQGRAATREYQRLRDAGMRFHSPPLDAGPTRCCYGRDPDGNVVELLEFTRPDDPLRLGS